MQEEIRNILISKYLNGHCTPEEKAEMEQWLQADPQNQKHLAQIKTIEEELHQLDLGVDADTEGEWEKLKGEIRAEGKVRRLSSVRYWRAAAAVVALAAVGWLISIWVSGPESNAIAQEFATEKGETQTIELADGSTIQLNADSKLTLSTTFNNEERRLTLEGEAYFKVAKNSEKPFIVETGNVYTQVLGTAFNISAYPEERDVQVAVTEGVVQFRSNSTSGLRLEANTAAQYRKADRVFTPTDYDSEQSLDWLQGNLIFKDIPLTEVLADLERKYNVEIDDQTNQSNLIYSDYIQSDDTIKEVMVRLARALQIEIEQTANGFVLR